MQTVIANRNDFFMPDACPVALRSIHGDAAQQHEGDLTDVRHTHNFSELIVITRGGGSHWINGTVYEVSMGDVFLIQGRTEHYFTERHDLEMFNIMFDDLYLQDQLKSLRSLPGFNAFFLFEPTYRKRHNFESRLHLNGAELQRFDVLLRQMERESVEAKAGCDLILLARILEIFVAISRAYVYAEERNPKVHSLLRLGNLISRMEKEPGGHWSIAQIARIAGMAPSTLLPIFKKVTGCSPIAYLLQIRLRKAAAALLSSDEAISVIAEQCGFPDSNYFSRQFRKEYRCSPRTYRIRFRNE